MGYTHYWKFKKIKGKAAHTEARYQGAVKAIQKMVKRYNDNLKTIDAKHPDRLAGYTAHVKLGQYGGVDFNGTDDNGHENFLLREHFNQNEDFNFCKTAQKSYDIVVTAALIILKHYLKDAIEVSSDGYRHEWQQGLELAQQSVKSKGLIIPTSIKLKLMEVS